MKKFSLSDKGFDVLNKIFLTVIVILIVYPLVFVISASIKRSLSG